MFKSLIKGLMLSAFVVGVATVAAKHADKETTPPTDHVEEVQLSQLDLKQQESVERGFAVSLVF